LASPAIRTAVQRRFKVAVKVDNDANVCALAHCFFGIGLEITNFVYFAVGSGVGSGVVLNGKVFRGAHGLAGEVGHITVDIHGPKCPCGNYGCLELYTTVSATLARWVNAPAGVTRGDEVAGVDALIRAADLGENEALATIARTAEYLSVGIVNVINSFDPDVVVIGRELARSGALLIDPIRRAVAERAFPAVHRPVRIEPDSLADATPITGAFCLVLSDLMDPAQPLLDQFVTAAS
jgi:predicted NBD/HSP70 family sugar kinase